MTKALVLVMLLSGCGPAFREAYAGEPECGVPQVIHATLGGPCDGPVVVACDCAERTTLYCSSGAWVSGKYGCPGGLSSSVN